MNLTADKDDEGRGGHGDPVGHAEARRKGGEHSHGGTHEQHVRAGEQSHKNS